MPNTIQKNSDITYFWEQGVFHYFKGKDNLKIHYAHFNNPSTSLSLVISPGRCESYLKYKETIFEFYKQGYSVFILEHRGQGLSERMLSNLHKGYVKYFDDYAYDLHLFITTIVTHNNTNIKPYLIAHSMGCAITLRMLQLYPNVIKSAVLLSPMIAINTGMIPTCIANHIASLGEKINQCLSKEPWYFLGQSNYKPQSFSKNRLTHCKERYQDFIDLYAKNSNIQLGGVTIHWLYEALKAEKKIFSSLDRINTPICIFQAENDLIVDNKKQNLFCQQLHKHSPTLVTQQPTVIKAAYHELLFENDTIRSETLNKSLQFLDSSTSD